MSYELPERQRSHEPVPTGSLVIFTDLDGTMVDKETHSFTTVMPVLTQALVRGVPVNFVTSKTAAEILHLQESIGLVGKVPFIVENGHGIFIPKTYFPFSLVGVLSDKTIKEQDNFYVVEADMNFATARKVLDETAHEVAVPITKQSDLTLEQFMQVTGFTSPDDADRALKRMYQEGFTLNLPAAEKPAAWERLYRLLVRRGYDLTAGGMFAWIMQQGVTKGSAVAALQKLYRRQMGSITSVGIGDAPNDVSFLRICDKRYLVANPNKIISVPPEEGITSVSGVGPAGWNSIVTELLGGTAT